MNSNVRKIYDEETVFEAKSLTLPNKKAVGELFEDFYVVPVLLSDGSTRNQLVQTNKFYIREYSINTDTARIEYTDYMIDPHTLTDVTSEPVFLGCDLARQLDLTYFDGEYK